MRRAAGIGIRPAKPEVMVPSSWMLAILSVLTLTVGLSARSGATAPAATPSPAPGECRQAAGPEERPSTITDDVANCVYTRLSGSRVRVRAAYTYASPLGRQNIFLGVDVLAGGNRLKWFGYRPVPIGASAGAAEIEIVFGLNSPPSRALTTDQVELFMYVGGGQIFFRKLFNLKLEWQL